MELSIVTTMYYSAPYLEEFYNRIKVVADRISRDYEIIFVNDGSPDNSVEKVLDLSKIDNKVNLVNLSRNFGHHKAIMTGLSMAKGDRIFLIDCDLEEPPELLDEFWHVMSEEPNFELVYGIQSSRKGGLLERNIGGLFFTLFNLFSETKIPKNFLTVRLMTKEYRDALKQFKEKEMVFAVVSELVGFNKKSIFVTKRHKGTSTYTMLKKFNLFINAITSSTARPLWIIFYIGLITTLLSTLYIFKTLIDHLFFKAPVDGWASIIVSIWFFGGLNMFFLGIIGIYLSRIFIEVKERPYTIIKSQDKKESDSANSFLERSK